MSAKAAKRERQRKQAGTVRAFREIPQDEMERAWRNATNPPIQVFQSPQFLASIYVDQGWLRLSVNRIRLAKGSDIHWDDGITWDELQQIKSLIGYGTWWAVECYPPDSQVVNVANMRHLWLFETTPPFGWKKSL